MSEMNVLGGLPLAPRIGTIRGMEIRFHLLTLVPILFWLIPGIMAGFSGFVYAAIVTAAFFGIILWHELGHAWAARRSYMRVNGILIWPLGGECQISGGMPSPRTEVLVAVAGPAAHFLLLAGSFVPLLLLSRGAPRVPVLAPAAGAAWSAWSLAFYILLFNLIPAFPLDGGRVLRGLLAPRLGELRATRVAVRIGQGFAVLYFLLSFVGRQPLLALLGAYIFFGAQQEYRAAMHSGRVYDPGSRNPFAAELGIKESWGAEARAGQDRPGFFRRLALRWRMRRLERETRRREKLQAEVDRLLEKVSREGLPSLTRRERRTLDQASSEYRDRR